MLEGNLLYIIIGVVVLFGFGFFIFAYNAKFGGNDVTKHPSASCKLSLCASAK